MKLIGPETKVGIFSLVAIIGLISLFMWLNGVQLLDNGSQAEAVFSHAEGLRPGAPVKLSGVDIGRITRIYFDDFKVIVVMHIEPGFEIPHPAKALIGSAGVIGDKYLEIAPAKPGEIPEGNGKRIPGQNLVSMEQFYTTAYEVLTSLKEITSDIKIMTNQYKDLNIKPQIYELVNNITATSYQLAEASNTANRFLREIDDNGTTAANLRQTLDHAKTVAANLEKFSEIVATKGPELETLINDAHQTMQSINQAAQTIDKAITKITSGNGEVSQTLNDASQAAKKVSEYVGIFEKISLKNNLGLGYRYDQGLTADYQMDLYLSDKHGLTLGIEDIGQNNWANLQWVFRNPNYNSRVGIYNSEFGVGFDLSLAPGFTTSFDLWDTKTANLGLTSALGLTKDWSLLVNGSANSDTWDKTWSVELWRHY